MIYLVRKNTITTKNKITLCRGISLFHDNGVWDSVEHITSRKELNEYMKDRYSKVEDRFDRNGEYLYTRFTEYVVYECYTDVNEEKLPSIIMVSQLDPMFELERLINSVIEEDYDDLKCKNGYRNKKQLIDFLIKEYELCLMTEQNNTIYLKTRIINNVNSANNTCVVLHLDFEENEDGIKIIDVY